MTYNVVKFVLTECCSVFIFADQLFWSPSATVTRAVPIIHIKQSDLRKKCHVLYFSFNLINSLIKLLLRRTSLHFTNYSFELQNLFGGSMWKYVWLGFNIIPAISKKDLDLCNSDKMMEEYTKIVVRITLTHSRLIEWDILDFLITIIETSMSRVPFS